MENVHHDSGDNLSNISQYENLIASVPGGIVVASADDNFTTLFANHGFYSMTGYTPEEFCQKFRNVGIRMLHPKEVGFVIKSAKEQMEQTGSFHVNARLAHKDQGYIWVYFNGCLNVSQDGVNRLYIMVADISEHQHTFEKLKKEQSFNELISTLSDESFFDCDLSANTVRYSRNFAERLGLSEMASDYREAFIQIGLFERGSLQQIGDDLLFSLDRMIKNEIHLTLPKGEDVWFLCRYNILMDAEGTPIRIVGKFIDITQHKIQIDELSELAQRDQLTGLYNKTATETLIKETLKMRRLHDSSSALLTIDIDNFKAINDRLGHLYGDAVLTQLAEHLKGLFRSDDIVGRIGGDEFFVFLKNCSSTNKLVEKAQKICSLFHKTYSEGDAFVTISASIGIALCPKDGTEFDELYKKSDAALYDAKASGKNTFSFFHDDLAQTYVSARTEIDVDTMKKSFKDNRVEYVFKLLYDSENPISSIQSVLQLVTESYGFSRGYIFEISADGMQTSNTFEWCSSDVTTQIQNLQNLPIESVATARNSFHQTGMFILKSISKLPDLERKVLEPQGIRSMFQFGVMDKGKFIGFIGFDDCIAERVPSDSEIDEICTVCHVLATFLLKHRSSEREMLHHHAVETVMNHINSYAYAIDPLNFIVLYENQNVVNLTSLSSIGKKCHLAYRGNPNPCEDCPIKQLNGADKFTTEIHNEKFDLYVRTDISLIDWLDRKACLICSVDVTEYKKMI